MSDEPVLLSSDRNGVRTLTLNRPHRKDSINRDPWIALASALTAPRNNRAVRAVVIGGAGGAFCSGADISNPDDSHPAYKMRLLTDVALALHELRVPTIAKVTGVAVGAEMIDADEARAQAVNFATVDASEAYAAFAERQEPSFTGQWALSRSEQTHA